MFILFPAKHHLKVKLDYPNLIENFLLGMNVSNSN